MINKRAGENTWRAPSGLSQKTNKVSSSQIAKKGNQSHCSLEEDEEERSHLHLSPDKCSTAPGQSKFGACSQSAQDEGEDEDEDDDEDEDEDDDDDEDEDEGDDDDEDDDDDDDDDEDDEDEKARKTA